jgi:hypothetical protein
VCPVGYLKRYKCIVLIGPYWQNAFIFFFNDLKCSNCLPSTSTHCRNLSATFRYGILLVSPGDRITTCTAFPLLNIRMSSNHFFKTPTKCTLYILHIFFLRNLSYMFRCATHHPQGEMRVLDQKCQLFTKLFGVWKTWLIYENALDGIHYKSVTQFLRHSF